MVQHEEEMIPISRRPLIDVYCVVLIAGAVVIGTLAYTFQQRLHPATCSPAFDQFTVDISNATKLTNVESLGSIEIDGMIYPPSTFFKRDECIRGCQCHVKPCINMCPSPDLTTNINYLDNETYFEYIYDLKVYDYSGQPLNTNVENFSITHINPCNDDKDMSIKYLNDSEGKLALMEDGKLFLVNKNTSMTLDHFHYCIDFIEDSPSVVYCNSRGTKDVFISMCRRCIHICTLLYFPFMIMTLVVYLVLPELQNFQGKAIIRYLICRLMANTVKKCFKYLPRLNNFCVGDTVSYLPLMTSYFWLNVLCLDLWRKLSNPQPVQGDLGKKNSRFWMYSVYAWICPVIIWLFAALKMRLIPWHEDTFITPPSKERWCHYKDSVAVVILYLPVSVLILVDNYLYLITAYRLRAHAKSTKTLHNDGSKRHGAVDIQVQRFNVYQRLGIVMGVNWIFHLLYFVEKPRIFMLDKRFVISLLLMVVADLIQSVVFFYILVCKKRILNLLKQRFWSSRITRAISTQISRRTSSTEIGS